MFTLITSSALLALLGVLVPVAIHLWNRRPGREVAVGSLRWLAAGANRRLRNLKLEQLWLLLLRAALVAVLAVAVAGPAWRQVLPAARGQVLLSPELQGSPALATLRPAIDSLRRRGYGLRWLAAGFPKVPGAVWRADTLMPGDSIPPKAAASLRNADFQWARVQQAAGVFAGQPLRVVTSAPLRNFQGTHPPLAANISWQTVPLVHSETWIQSAAVRGDSLRLLLGQSSERRTEFRMKSLPRPQPGGVVQAPGLPRFRFEGTATGSQLQPLANATSGKSTQPAVPVRTGPLRVLIFSGVGYLAETRTLRAGIQAAGAGIPVPVALTLTTRAPDPNAQIDWLFWLSDAPLPAVWREAVRKGTRVWQEAAGPGTATQSRVALQPGEFSEQIFRRTGPAADTAGGELVWADGFGRAVLSRRALGLGALYQLHTRLNPPWSNLADSPLLPAHLLDLLQPETRAGTAAHQVLALHDKRTLDPAQLQTPANQDSSLKNSPAKPGSGLTSFRFTDLRPWLVLVATVLFALERLLARRRDAQASSVI
ncbi:MAG: hypothetical protein JWR44_3627 [Hymenobacter sp.]|nr:hypothetical protein [Hymenobacter sp.]